MREDACLLVHGFAGNVDEIQYLAQHLQARELDTHTVLLAGHGLTKKALTQHTRADWIGSAQLALDELSKTYTRVHLIGFSMGGLICARLAQVPAVGKVVLVNTPVYIWNFKVILSDIASGVRRCQLAKLKRYQDSIGKTPLRSGVEFLKMLLDTKKKLTATANPTLIIQCKRDETVRDKSALYLHQKLGGNAVLRLYDGGCHLIFKQDGALRDRVCEDIYQFLVSDA